MGAYVAPRIMMYLDLLSIAGVTSDTTYVCVCVYIYTHVLSTHIHLYLCIDVLIDVWCICISLYGHSAHIEVCIHFDILGLLCVCIYVHRPLSIVKLVLAAASDASSASPGSQH